MSAEYKFNFFVVQLAREEYNSSDPNKTIFVKVHFYQKPCLVDKPSMALPFRTFKHADECAKSYERIGYKTKVLKFEAKQTNLTGAEK
jgi:hypothetical protein